MTFTTMEQLFAAIIYCTKPSEIKDILFQLGDRPELKIEEAFGFGNFQWRFYGERDSNISTINLGSKPSRSIIERITNAVDAVLEKEMEVRGGTPPSTPMEAAKLWFGRPPSTNDTGIFTWNDFAQYDHDKHVSVALLPGDEDQLPTIDIKDNGIGILSENFHNTILSLQKGIKLTRKYLAGAFGQGGSQTLSFSKYTVIISRRLDSNEVAFTIIKKMTLPEEYGEDAYVYMALRNNSATTIKVPSILSDSALNLYPKIEGTLSEKIRYVKSGTVVRHIGYRLEGAAGKLGPDKGNLYHLLNYLLFDPIIPFRVLDFRDSANPNNQLITGSRNRLMLLTLEDFQSGDTGTEIKTYAPREMISPLDNNNPCIALEYWIAFNWKKVGQKITLRTKSNGVYIDENHPILSTLNGQNQGEQTARIFKDLGLQMVGKHAIVHIDATRATKDVRTNLFASTREGFKEEQALKEILDILKNMLQEDETLFALERELLDKLLESETRETDAEVKKEITDLLLEAGFEGRMDGDTIGPGEGGNHFSTGRTNGRRPRPTPVTPLPTLPWPDVTRFEIVYPLSSLEIPKEVNRVIRIETDANFRYDREKRITLRFDPDVLEIASYQELNGGRKYWRVKCKQGIEDLPTGRAIATLTLPDGQQIISEIPFIVLPPILIPSTNSKGLVPEFDIKQTSPDEDNFTTVWEDLGEDNPEDVAYKYLKTPNGALMVFYNTHFTPYKAQVEALQRNPAVLSLFIKNYEIWIGYHSILQQRQVSNYSDEAHFEKIQEKERALVAEMQIKQALKTANLQQENLKAKEVLR